MDRSIFSLIILILLSTTSMLYSQSVPQLVNYQGMLTDENGFGLEGLHTLKFSIFTEQNTQAGQEPIWGPQTFQNMPLVNGHFNVILGPTDEHSPNPRPINEAFSSQNAYLEIKIGDDPPISPRQQILSSPYAIHANTAEHSNTANSLRIKTKWQINILSSTITSDDSDIDDLKFKNLEIGKTYRLSGQLYINSPVADGAGVVRFENGSQIIGTNIHNQSSGGSGSITSAGVSIVFKAIDSELKTKFIVESTQAALVADGNNPRGGSYLVLEELSNHEETIQWK